LTDFRELTAQHTRGCVIMERPDLLVELAKKHGAKDTTARGNVIAELEAIEPRRSQFQPGDEIPERSFVYRWAKKYAFNDFGTYSRHFDVANYQDPDSATATGKQNDGSRDNPANHRSDLPVISP
jgi:hypothetical protein